MEKKPTAEKKPTEKKPAEKKPKAERKSVEKTPTGKKPAEKTPAAEKKSAEKTLTAERSAEMKSMVEKLMEERERAAEKFGVCSSGDDQDGNTDNAQLPELLASAEDRELKHQLLKKYSGYLNSLRQELSKKKKKGKLPRDARQQLLNWWELHYKWPYPSETQKVALAEATGLDLKQINNWFINQRKRHWKPSEDMQFVVMDGYHAPNTALYMDGQSFMGEDLYRLGP
ncbi:hypothetical protein B296_00041436 [Ensete ventricosum]|uniref:Homeobox domain-containing protein n=1 Tax=Ensete ventricosum TaxID=4639 RepID=A0A426YPC4_ENSVE|nr:hypothetical protein B296_00041436 [Ensete ventricosum]